MRQAAEIVVARIDGFRQAAAGDFDTFEQGLAHVVATSGWTRDEVVSLLRELRMAMNGSLLSTTR